MPLFQIQASSHQESAQIVEAARAEDIEKWAQRHVRILIAQSLIRQGAWFPRMFLVSAGRVYSELSVCLYPEGYMFFPEAEVPDTLRPTLYTFPAMINISFRMWPERPCGLPMVGGRGELEYCARRMKETPLEEVQLCRI